MRKSSIITCIGEILWDALPGGLFLGGAPLNVCLHLHELGGQAVMISRVGEDRLGSEALNRIRRSGLDLDYIQVDEEHETGFVKVKLNSKGDPEYEIIEPAAWDFIDIKQEEVSQLLKEAWAVVLGTLAQRRNPSLKAVLELECLKVLDINLRAPHYQKGDVMQLARHSDLIKMNEQELNLLQKWCSFDYHLEEAIRAVSSRFDCPIVCVTRGSKGSVLLYNNHFFEHAGYPVKVEDAVGAGDAFLAALLQGLKSGRDESELLPFANAAGAYVASQSGANPNYSIGEIESIVKGK